MNVIELSIVAKMLTPAAHQGIRCPPRKKSFVDLFFRAKEAPSQTMPARYRNSVR